MVSIIGGNSRGGDMTESQDDKYLTHNDHIDLVVERLLKHVILAIGFSSGSSYSLSLETWTENYFYNLVSDTSPSVDSDFDFLLPDGIEGPAIFRNDTGFVATILVNASPTGRSVTVNDGATALIYSDGANVDEPQRDFYDISGFVFGGVDDHYRSLVFAHIAVRSFNIPAGVTGGQSYAQTASGSGEVDQVYSLQKNSSEFGTLTFSSLDNTGVFAAASSTSFVAGDRFTMVGPDHPSPDILASELSDVYFTIIGNIA